jgi:hypothetical protein
MNQQNPIDAGTVRHRAEDDLFHYDRANLARSIEPDAGPFRAKGSARAWVRGFRPRWLIGAAQPLLRPRTED